MRRIDLIGEFVRSLRRATRVVMRSAAVTCVCAMPAAATDQSSFSEMPVRGVVKAVDYASLSTEQPMRVRELALREGQAFRRGEILVSFDCRRQRAEQKSAAAQVREAELNLSSSMALDKYNAIGRNDVEIARARLERVVAEKTALDARVQDCEIAAPFDGRVVELTVRPLEFTAAQRPYLVIIDDSSVELELIAPAPALSAASSGDDLEFAVDELGGKKIAARIKSLGAAVDPVSKTAKLIATVSGKYDGLLAGMSGTATLKPRSMRE